jgi:hypothetical protein
MGKICKGGFLDGAPVYTREDQDQCILGGGHIEDTGGGGCAAASIVSASLKSREQNVTFSRMELHGDFTRSFLRLKKLFGEHPIVQDLISLNEEAFNEIQAGRLNAANMDSKELIYHFFCKNPKTF